MSNSSRLTRRDWLVAGVQVLASDGPGALRAEPMSRRMNTTKGSFYWHFKDVPDFHAALLAQWSDGALAALDSAQDAAAPAAAQLRGVCQSVAMLAARGAGAAVRAWAHDSAAARAALARFDAHCHARLVELLADTGITNPEMARILHAAAIGMPQLPGEDGAVEDAIGSLVDLVLALRD
ncbi:TetR/AcrR family transcriptional regulator [Sediminimonas sp.]|uniref:TetR/AcrR family transcriptional regulator n=1 Tax=Sediminimonas sp. TaxID=2823379 RepID=UPI0025DC2272|nr:TetR/AcrR family transcriptional regulator [Sediminimonas sp.]